MNAHLSRAGRGIVLALVLAGALGGVRTLFHLPRGLTAEYFTTTERLGPPAFSTIDPAISTDQINRRWRNAPPESFSVRWTGYLIVPASGFYHLATTSDDGSWLSVDGRPLVDNGGRHGAVTKSARTWLDRGAHFVLLEYVQAGGSYEIGLSWGRDDGGLSPLPAWCLSPRRLSPGSVVAARALDWLAWVAVASLLVAGWIALMQVQWYPRATVRYPRLTCLAVFVGFSILHTWPLATDPVHLSRNDNADTVLNEWTLSWIAHQAPRVPLNWARSKPIGLFDANIFYPERNTLAYSESLFVQAAMGAPLRWAGASPVLTYNLLLMAGFALTGWAMCLVLARWTGDWIAGLVGGIVMGFNAHTLTRMPHLQAQHVEFLPFALLALDAVLVEPRVRHALALAGWFTLQALTSFYLLVFTTVALAAATIARPEAWWGKRLARVAPYLLLAAVTAVALLLPFLLPYWHVHHDQGFVRPLDDVAGFAATWRDYLTTPSRAPRLWVARWTSTTGLYPGAIAMALAAIAVVSGTALRDPKPRMCLALGICGVVLSFGPQVPGYTFLYQTFTPLQGIRAVSRFGYLGLVAVAVLAAYGMARIRWWMRNRRALVAVSLLLVALVTLEPLAAPIGYTQAPGVPRIYDALADQPNAVVVELPLPLPLTVFLNAPFLLNSTVHWKTMVNGYSGFVPASYYEHYQQLRDFPGPESVATLQRLGVTHAFVHTNILGPERSAQVQHEAAFQQIDSEGPIVLYRVTRSAAAR